MIAFLQLFLAPLVAAALTIWAAWLTLAAESDADLPRALGGDDAPEAAGGSLSRHLHVAHLALLVLAGAAAGAAVAWWARSATGGLIRLIVAIGLVWIVGDLLPRIVGTVAPELTRPARTGAAATLAPLRPFLRLAGWADARVRRRIPASDARHPGPAERDMLLGVFSLADTTVAEVMTPRIDIVAVDSSASREEVIATLRRSEHARLLVYDGHPDAVAGVIYAKDILAGTADGAPWTAAMRPASFVPEGKALDRQLRDFQRGPSHLAVVVDEFGGTAGLVTLEDILEQIVGEIQDEYDTDEVAPIQTIGPDHLRVEGGVALSELEGLLGHSFAREDVSTVGGLMLAEFGRVPRSGESIDIQGYRLTVEQVVRRRVRRVGVQRLAEMAPVGATERAAP